MGLSRRRAAVPLRIRTVRAGALADSRKPSDPSVGRRVRSRLCDRLDQGADEEGFTLIELVIVLVILPMIIGGVTIAMITSLRAADTRSPSDPACKTDPTCAQSTAERIAESHDSQITSATLVRDVQTATSLETTTSVPLCPRSGTQRQQVLGLEWILGSRTYAISYMVVPVGTFGSYSLVRQTCINGSFQSSLTASHNLSSATGVAVNLICSSSDANCVQDTQSGPTSSLNISLVEVKVSESSGFNFSLTASPRQYLDSTSGPNSATEALVASTPPLLLGPGGAQCAPGNEGLTVYGTLAVNSSAGGSVKVGNQGLTAQQVYSQNPNTGGSGPVSGSYNSTGSSPYANGPALVDPYSVLPSPSAFAANTYVYSSPLTQGNDPTDPTHTRLLSGIYILRQGMSGSLTSDPGGVFFYVTGGAVSLTGNSSLNLSAMTSGLYADILLYQVPADTSSMSLQGTPSVTALNGVIDVWSATVNLSGNSSVAALGLVAAKITCNGHTSGTFGPVPTTTTVGSSLNPSVSGAAVTFTATVTSAGGGTPTGGVTFVETPNGSSTPTGLCSNVGLTAGVATCTTSALVSSGSPYQVTASYGGTLGYQPSSGSMTQNVVSATSTTVSSSVNPSVSGQSVQFAAAVAGPGTPSGKVTFTITDVHTTTYSCTGSTNSITLSNGSATCTIPVGQFSATNSPITVVASYGGDGGHAPSSGTLTQNVNSGTLHITALGGFGTLSKNKKSWTATVNVTVQDSFNNPVSGVVVTGSWNPAGPTPVGCTTQANGQCSFTTNTIATSIANETWTVSNLVLAGYTYDPTKNSASMVVVTQ